ncbi:conserved hypothetical protein [Frankia alni ACN14a]|uniref:Uncharacterized protein n=1 Tax=Frankia alni (strain DSM 45986 / CECT 9034 / ACN14a) TaxID=326424 RepID=Q0RCS9_FRAAA|nr:conserved hypothetical protein [Frankia alni ACN14a]
MPERLTRNGDIRAVTEESAITPDHWLPASIWRTVK